MRRLSPRLVLLLRAGCVVFAVGLLLTLFGPFTAHDAVGTIPDLCLMQSTLGTSCPGCGMGRSLASLCQLDLVGSLRFHPFGIVLLGFCFAGSFFPGATARCARPVACVLALALLAFWLMRLAFATIP